jgi:uncharacterized membrane protein YagU involved in acid resistance
MTNAVHWVTGIGWGMQYGLVVRKLPGGGWAGALVLGPVVWLSSYVILGGLGVYKPIWQYDAQTLGKDLLAHLVYGSSVALSFAAMAGRYWRHGGGQGELRVVA